MTSEEQHDVVVVGGGVAGVNCALECFDIQLDTILVEAGATLGGQLPEILHSVRNVAAGFSACMMLRPSSTPPAPACIAPSTISKLSASVLVFGPPAIRIGSSSG